MNNIAKSLANNALAAMTAKAPTGVVSAIKQASARTGVNFAYMVQQAAAESSFNPTAKAKTSSASGLYQFIESTWLDMVKRHGDKYGVDTSGMSRKDILHLRNDASLSAGMAAEFANENKTSLNNNWAKGEKDIGATELYLAHFLGAGGASSFLNARDRNPLTPAADIMPRAANANRNVFYEKGTGRAKSLQEVYAFFDKKFEIANNADIKVAMNEMDMPSSNEYKNLASAEMIVAMQDAANAPRETSDYLNSLVYMRESQNASPDHNSIFTKSYAPAPYRALVGNPIDVMMLAQVNPFNSKIAK
ncbi:MAG: transglycosylase SLT domain-containing protein [Micavibrio sp.]|nr:transglycosylase SLT domain-containing protein [Micavibrio sp.]